MVATRTAGGTRAGNVDGRHGRHEAAGLDMFFEKTALNTVDGQVDVVVGDIGGAVQIDQRVQFLEEQGGRGFEGDGTGRAGLGRGGVKRVGGHDSLLAESFAGPGAVRATAASTKRRTAFGSPDVVGGIGDDDGVIVWSHDCWIA